MLGSEPNAGPAIPLSGALCTEGDPGGEGARNAFGQETCMLRFIGGTIGAIFLIGLIVVVLFFKLIF